MRFRRSDREIEREASSLEDRSVARDIALVVAGIGIGSGIALLMAPDSGEEVRHAIGRRCQKTMRHLGRRTENFRDLVEDVLDQAADLRHHSKLRRFLKRRKAEARVRVA